MEAINKLLSRIQNREKKSLLDVNTKLNHFALITYQVPIECVQKYIPNPFKLWSFEKENKEYVLLSAVPFQDYDFSFYRLFPFFKFAFFQTNYRTYIIDERTGEISAWLFGTTLGSWLCAIPKNFWKMPWEKGQYHFRHLKENGYYSTYEMNYTSIQGKGITSWSCYGVIY